MSVHDETWDRPICQICWNVIKYGKKENHGDGICNPVKVKSSIKIGKEPRSYSFFYHYNKPMSRKFGRNKLTVRRRGACYLVDSVRCYVNTETKDNKTQPHCVITGKSKNLKIIQIAKDGRLIATLWD